MTKAYTLLIVGFSLGCVADIFICRYGKITGSKADLFLGVFLYSIDTTLWTFSIKAGLPFWKAGLLWTLGSLVLCVIVGMAFRERPTLTNWIGIAMAVVAAILVEIES